MLQASGAGFWLGGFVRFGVYSLQFRVQAVLVAWWDLGLRM
jgi:hypothetical protein